MNKIITNKMSLIMKKSVPNIHELIAYQSDQEFCLEDLTVSMQIYILYLEYGGFNMHKANSTAIL